jgi:hypothetical protein
MYCFQAVGFLVVFLAAGLLVTQPSVAAQQSSGSHEHSLKGAPKLIHNEDSSNFFVRYGPEGMTRESLQSFVDAYAGTQVSYLFFNPCSQRTVYRSKVWDCYADIDVNDLPEGTRDAARRWIENLRLLDERKLDPLAIWIDRCREKEISPWVTVRMNDLHTVHELDSPYNNEFWRVHPEYWRVPSSVDDEHFTADRCAERALDFAIPEVREYTMLLLRELLERYDVDGIELDWMRFWAHFAPGREAEGGVILTKYMAEVRELTETWARRRGHPVKISARVPARPEHARGLGLDGIAWAKKGLVDLLIPTPFWFTTNTDIPIELWRELLGAAAEDITLAAGIEIRVHNRFVHTACTYNDLESSRGQIASLVDRGAEHVYMFNFFLPTPVPGGVWTEPEFKEFLNDGADLDKILSKPRRHIVTYDDAVPVGVPVACMLPASLKGTCPAAFRIHTGPKPTTGRAVIRVGLADRLGVDAAKFKARINGVFCELVDADKLPSGYLSAQEEFKIKRELHFAIAPKDMNRGYNVVEVMLAAPGDEQEIVWVEIRVEP